MPHSYAHTQSLTCPRCGRTFEAEIWLILDAAERPDLLEKAKDGTIHQIVCPTCGPIDQADAPLLLYFPVESRLVGEPLTGAGGPGGRLLFSPAQSTTAEQGTEQARGLLARLKASLGDAWQEDWLANGLPAIPRPLLPVVIPKKVERDAGENTFHRHLLQRFQGLVSLHQHTEKTPALWPQVLNGWQALIIEADEQGEALLATNARGNLANACIGLYEVTGDARFADQAKRLLDEISQVFNRQQMSEGLGIVQYSLGVLFARRYERSGDEAHAQAAGEYFRNALEEYHRETVPNQWATVQHSLGILFSLRYERSGDEAHAQAAEEYFRNALEEYHRETVPSQWALTQQSIGRLFASRYERNGDEAHAWVAEEHYRNALEVRCRETAPSEWAMTQYSLGHLFARRYERSGDESHAQAAEEYFRNALEEYRRETVPKQWATVQYSLGTLFARQYDRRGDEAHAQTAEEHYHSALEVRRRETSPSDWALTQKALGILFLRRYERSGEEAHAQAAEEYFRNALEEYRRETDHESILAELNFNTYPLLDEIHLTKSPLWWTVGDKAGDIILGWIIALDLVFFPTTLFKLRCENSVQSSGTIESSTEHCLFSAGFRLAFCAINGSNNLFYLSEFC